MRLWSIHPKYLDRIGLVALWREGLLARKVLLGWTKGYKSHPQLFRFRACPSPVVAIDCYLQEVLKEADRRGYHFDSSKISLDRPCGKIKLRRGQRDYELLHRNGGNMKRLSIIITAFLCIISLCPTWAVAWHDATHMSVARAAGLGNYAYLAVGADMAKEKAGYVERMNHHYNAPRGTVVDTRMVLDQFKRYNDQDDTKGHLYGAIVASINDYIIAGAGGKYALYPLGYAMHYIGDLSMPFHNIDYDEFNKTHHSDNDGIVEKTGPSDETTDAKVARLAEEIQKRMDRLPPLELSRDIAKFYDELAQGIAEIANRSIEFGYLMKDANPQIVRMKEDEVYMQLAYSARLLKAVYKTTKK